MCIDKFEQAKCKMINRSKLGRAVRGVLTLAKVEKRLVCGLLPAIAYLEENPDDVLLCVLPQTSPGDPGSHMQTVLLQAFCFENYIPVIQVDSSEKLADYCDISERNNSSRCLCAIVTAKNDGEKLGSDGHPEEVALSATEQVLTDFYECTLEEFPRPIIELPI